MEKYNRGETPYFYFTVKTLAGVLVNPANGATITIEDWKGKTLQAYTDMTTTGTAGLYYYNSWTVPATAPGGTYRARAKSLDGTVDCRAEVEFEVLER